MQKNGEEGKLENAEEGVKIMFVLFISFLFCGLSVFWDCIFGFMVRIRHKKTEFNRENDTMHEKKSWVSIHFPLEEATNSSNPSLTSTTINSFPSGPTTSQGELEKMNREVDIDGDGKIDLNEFVELNTKGMDSDVALENLSTGIEEKESWVKIFFGKVGGTVEMRWRSGFGGGDKVGDGWLVLVEDIEEKEPFG